MPFVPTVNGVRSEMLQTLGGQQIETVINTRYDVPPVNAGALTGINDALIAWWINQIKPLASQDLILRGVRSTDLTSISGPVVETAAPANTKGTIATISLPNNVAIVVTHRTAQRGRSFRGRTYQPGLPAADETTSVDANAAEVATLVSAFANLISVLTANGFTYGVLSTVANHVLRSSGLLTPITSSDANTAFDSQRRRLLGRGN